MPDCLRYLVIEHGREERGLGIVKERGRERERERERERKSAECAE